MGGCPGVAIKPQTGDLGNRCIGSACLVASSLPGTAWKRYFLKYVLNHMLNYLYEYLFLHTCF